MLERIFPVTLSRLDGHLKDEPEGPEDFLEWLKTQRGKVLAYLPDLALLEYELNNLDGRLEVPSIETPVKLTLNPTLKILKLSWKGLPEILQNPDRALNPEEGTDYIGIWFDPSTKEKKAKSLSAEELLAIKIVFEDIPYEEVQKQSGLTFRQINRLIQKATDEGLILKPEPRIKRPDIFFSRCPEGREKFQTARVFTLQWHITQACDLHCRHCYDRSQRRSVTYEQAVSVLKNLWRFCQRMNVKGQVSFSGGNPFLHPEFFNIYRQAYEMGFQVAILGNPVPEETLKRLLQIAKPVFYQVSLEGLPEENDYIRGKGNFNRVLEFLDLLRKYNIYSMVMLTLTERNIDQIIPLADILKDRVDLFTFNRLASVGEGANLKLPDKERYIEFLGKYLKASETNQTMALKDNLINIYKYKNSQKLFGGCTGYGCGAAFNFVSVLSDGEVHACRKFPSYIGNIYEQELWDIYHSPQAEGYRNGPPTCRDCPLVAACRGCLAVTYGLGKDPLKEKDPYCFI